MSNLALHVQSMEASLEVIGERVAAFPAEDAALAGWLQLAVEGLTSLSEAVLGPHGMHPSDFRALMRLFSSPTGCVFPGELSAHLGQTPANITRIANFLVERGLVERTPSTDDRRRVELRITAAGRAFVLRVLPELFQPLRRACAVLEAGERQALQGGLRRLVGALDEVLAV